jgi:penicillin-binding protein 1A
MGARKTKLRRFAIGIAMAIGIAVVSGIVLWQRCGLRGCPNVDQLAAYQPGGQSIVYDGAGRKIADLAPVQRTYTKIGTLPDHVPAAFVAIEDKRFYQHHGIDYRRVLGALAADVKAGGFVQGFSTITMQIAGSIWRDRVPRYKKTLGRKFIEVRLAKKIEGKYSKAEILELYLNNIYFGGGAYGIEAASQVYFRKRARNLTVAQAATLAALPKSSVLYDPRSNPSRAKRRRDLILTEMAKQGKLSAKEAERAKQTKLAVWRDPPRRRRESTVAPYFVEAVRRVLEDRFGEDFYTSPLRIYTTLDRRAQQVAEEELTRQLRAVESGAFGQFKGSRYSPYARDQVETDYLQGAVVIIDARNGAVIAHVGGRDYRQSTFDRVTRAKRQPGSAFKPFVYAAALSEGYVPSQHISDKPLKMELPGGEVWEPKNFTEDFDSITTMRNALVQSRNIPTIRLAADVGLDDVARVARISGIRSTIAELPSMAIGVTVVTPLEIARAYTPFATLGSSVQPRWIDRVEDLEGNVIWKPEPKKSAVLDPGVAYLVTDMLRDAVDHGTGTAVRRVGYSGPAAGKTGTTNDGTDAWFVGFNPQLVGAVWFGFDTPKEIVKDASGGRIAAPVWGRIMKRINSGRPGARAWARPESVIQGQIDPASGLLLVDGCSPRRGRAEQELFLKYSRPASICPRGTPQHEPNVGGRAVSWIKRAWHRAGDWVAAHFGNEKEEVRPRRRERYLGVPKLPRAQDVPSELEMDTIEPPADTADTLVIPRIDPETLSVDTLLIRKDTLKPDTVPQDTLVASRISHPK